MNCEHCGNTINGNFCSNCGNSVKLERINFKHIKNEIGSLLFLKKGFLYTVKELLIQPGKCVEKFLLKDRNRILKPFVFLVITSIIYTFVSQFMPFEDAYISFNGNPNSFTTLIFAWFAKNFGYTNIFIGILTALWLSLFFRKYQYNYFEILILLCFTIGVFMLILSFFGIVSILSGSNLMQMGAIIATLYLIWSIGQFFENKFQNYIKVIFAYLFGMLAFVFVSIGIGVLIDTLFL